MSDGERLETVKTDRDRAVSLASIVIAAVLIVVVGLVLNLVLLFEGRAQREILIDCLTPGSEAAVTSPEAPSRTGHVCFDEEQNRQIERTRAAVEKVLAGR